MANTLKNLDIQENIERFLEREDMGRLCLVEKQVTCGRIKKQMKIDWETAKLKASYEEHYEYFLYEYFGFSPHSTYDKSDSDVDPSENHEFLEKLLISEDTEPDGSYSFPQSITNRQLNAFTEILHNLIDFEICLETSNNLLKEIKSMSDLREGLFDNPKNPKPIGAKYPDWLQDANKLVLIRKNWKALDTAMNYYDNISSSIRSGKYDGLLSEYDITSLQTGIDRKFHKAMNRTSSSSLQLRYICPF